MARFDASKDVQLKSWVIGDASDKYLEVSVVSYNGGEPKMQVVRKFTYKNGRPGFGKMGRLTLDETRAFARMLPEVQAFMGEPLGALIDG